MEDDKNYVEIACQYIDDVLSGAIPACIQVKQACQRQLDDLTRAADPEDEFKYEFNIDAANRICRFVEKLPHVKGRWKTKNLTLEPWQCFMLTTVFGWLNKETKFRRFKKVYVEIPRKNSKSTIAAAVALYMLSADKEPGPEVFAAAVTKDQAKIAWDVAHQMVKATPKMQASLGLTPQAKSIVNEGEAGFFRPLSRDADTLEGLNPHCAVIDELHAHKTREVYDVLDMGTGARQQPLIWVITTAGDNRNGICFEQHDAVMKILDRTDINETYFGIIYTIDPEDNWYDPESLRKANPNYGVSVIAENLEEACQQAQRSSEAQNTFLTKRLNVWVSTGVAYFNMLSWKNKCKQKEFKIEDFYGQPCYIALDLASTVDVAAKIYLFQKGKKRYVFGKYYLPASAAERGHPNYDRYRGWSRSDLLTLTPGECIDFDYIEQDLREDVANYQVLEVAYDPFQATQFRTRLESEGFNMVAMQPSVKNFSEPMKVMEGMILQGSLCHNGDPILDWMIGNVYGKPDQKDNIYPRKVRRENKIDGAVATIMAIGRDLYSESTISVYESGGLKRV